MIAVPKKLTVITIIIAVACLSGLFSYYSIKQFMFVGDRMYYGKKQSELAAEIRDELLKRTDIEKVSFSSSDGISLSGFYFKRPGAVANILLCHYYKGAKEFMYGYLNLFPKCNILAFDFRAHGHSDGSVISLGCHEYKDVVAAAEFFVKRVAQDTASKVQNNQTISQEKTPPQTTEVVELKREHKQERLPMIFLGVSMGGASCLKAVEMRPDLCDALVIDSTFSNLEKMFLRGYYLRVKLPYYPFFPIIRAMFHYFGNCDIKKMSPIECVKHIEQPILFIHSCTDSLTPPSNSIELYANSANEKSALWIGPKCRHGWLHSYQPEMYKRKVESFLNRTVCSNNPIKL